MQVIFAMRCKHSNVQSYFTPQQFMFQFFLFFLFHIKYPYSIFAKICCDFFWNIWFQNWNFWHFTSIFLIQARFWPKFKVMQWFNFPYISNTWMIGSQDQLCIAQILRPFKFVIYILSENVDFCEKLFTTIWIPCIFFASLIWLQP